MEPIEIQGAGLALNMASKLVFEEPEAERLLDFIGEDVFEEVPFGEDDEAVVAGAQLIRAWCLDHKNDGTERFAETLRDLKSEWFMLFIGPSVPHAPSWAGYYLSIKSELKSELTLAVRRLYRTWGFEPDGVNKEPDDNLGILLGFISELIYTELTESEQAEAAANAQLKVLQEYVLPWITAWRWSVAKYAKSDLYRGVGELVFGIVRAYAARFGVVFVEDGQNSHFSFEKE